ncbi:hypothetical protein RIF29_40030 [Crotalaria pallida]|uniref:Uncharacterized protein n=1 Tax=Crotalaria pallida TaxID=3830 RepID=A0AAN9E2W4_CROPI
MGNMMAKVECSNELPNFKDLPYFPKFSCWYFLLNCCIDSLPLFCFLLPHHSVLGIISLLRFSDMEAEGAARDLAYLHELAKPPIVHNYIKLGIRGIPLVPILHRLEGFDSNLESFSISESLNDRRSLTSLEWFRMEGCPKFVSFPEGGFSAPNLTYFNMDTMESLKSLPEDMHTLFPSLTCMLLLDCPQLECCSEGGLQSGSLVELNIFRCPKLVASRIKWGLHGCTSLHRLEIEDENVESFPEQGLLPATLSSLRFFKCSNLKTLDYKGLCHLTSLETLRIDHCPRLEFLPKEGLPSSLFELEIFSCPMLKQRFQGNLYILLAPTSFSFRPHFTSQKLKRFAGLDIYLHDCPMSPLFSGSFHRNFRIVRPKVAWQPCFYPFKSTFMFNHWNCVFDLCAANVS